MKIQDPGPDPYCNHADPGSSPDPYCYHADPGSRSESVLQPCGSTIQVRIHIATMQIHIIGEERNFLIQKLNPEQSSSPPPPSSRSVRQSVGKICKTEVKAGGLSK